MNPLTDSPATSYLVDVFAVDVDDNHNPHRCGMDVADRAVDESLETGLPAITESSSDGVERVALSVPVYRDSGIVSFAVFVADGSDEKVGVFEVWQPIGEYDELNMTKGVFGTLDRFQNVSSFVRFEKGSGLPGQVWQNMCFVIHDDLPSHPGFLRAAGASAESLQIACGIPVGGDPFLASVLLISSDATPIARGYEVWRQVDDRLVLESNAYQHLDDSLRCDIGTSVPVDESLAGLPILSGGVAICEDDALILANRSAGRNGHASEEPGEPLAAQKIKRVVCVPFYEGTRVTTVLTLLI